MYANICTYLYTYAYIHQYVLNPMFSYNQILICQPKIYTHINVYTQIDIYV